MEREQINPALSYLYFEATEEEKKIHGSKTTVVPVLNKEVLNRPLRKEKPNAE